MKRPLKQFTENGTNIYSKLNNLEYPFRYTSLYIAKAKLELNNDIIRSKKRYLRRNPSLEGKSAPTLSRYNIRSNSALPFHLSPNSFLLKSSFSDQSATTNFTVNYLKPNYKLERSSERKPRTSPPSYNKDTRFSLNSPDTQKRTSILQCRIETKSRLSFTTFLMKQKLKDEYSQGQLKDFKEKKHDNEEIMEHMALFYTFQMIEKSACVDDRDWSGNYIHCIEDDFPFLYAGGYGLVDGVTECKHINLAATQYQNIDLINDEAIDALSHMYSLHHLIDGNVQKCSDSFKFPERSTISYSEDSQSSRFSFISIRE